MFLRRIWKGIDPQIPSVYIEALKSTATPAFFCCHEKQTSSSFYRPVTRTSFPGRVLLRESDTEAIGRLAIILALILSITRSSTALHLHHLIICLFSASTSVSASSSPFCAAETICDRYHATRSSPPTPAGRSESDWTRRYRDGVKRVGTYPSS